MILFDLKNKINLIVLKGPHKFEVLPNSEFTIKRSAYKDNNSEYFIDNKRAQYKEIQQLLISNGVDLEHNRFLILQVCIQFT